jgi:NhaP-type Na+/H+ and K+/H+ antiporter
MRASEGVRIRTYDPLTQKEEAEQCVNALFFLVSPENNPAQHLRILAKIAGRVDEDSFMPEWLSAKNEKQLKKSILYDDRFQSLIVRKNSPTAVLADKPLREIKLPKGCLITMLQRGSKTIVPNGNTVLSVGDRLTVIGDDTGMRELRKLYVRGRAR